MGKNDRLSRDQKRKAKLKKRAERSHKHESLAYHGTKYKADEFIPALYRAEIGLYESFVMTERELTDDDVEEALSALILRMREGPLPPLEERNMVTLTGEDEDETELIVWNVRRNWQILAERHPLPRRDDLIGILRTILHSLGIWRSKSMSSQGYLRYIEGFMKETGVNIRQVTEDLEPVPEPEDDPLLVLGRAWIEGREPAAAGEFAEEVESLLGLGAAERVLNVCQQLIGESRDKSVLPLLQAFAIRGHHAIRTEMG